jgi:acyl carrier protein
MAEEPIAAAIERIVRKVTMKDESEVPAGKDLLGFKMDSLDRVQILVALEDTYDISLTEEEVGRVKTMDEFVSLVEGKIAAKDRGA